MPKWKSNAKEFKVAVNYSEKNGYQTTIPKPIAEKMGIKDQVKFVLKGTKVEVEKP